MLKKEEYLHYTNITWQKISHIQIGKLIAPEIGEHQSAVFSCIAFADGNRKHSKAGMTIFA